MRKKWILAAALLTVIAAGSGTWLHAYASADKTTAPNTATTPAQEQSDGDGEYADDQEQSDGDGEQADDQEQEDNAGDQNSDNDAETNDD
ncbi:hypothetical protein [Paenibacillus albus]|uniref:Uncharacterized protein n=1 Tax=Paenibacillus albus TaxID=2495582 RepID=A0A3S9A5X0_9BACL|nr:hypothetical protein [Paenibacillus albus]AZN41111.1 hypothetical protein EJC50_16610 [Paenibacillus albus]